MNEPPSHGTRRSYYYRDWPTVVRRAEVRLEVVRIRQRIAAIEDSLALLERMRAVYPPRKPENAPHDPE